VPARPDADAPLGAILAGGRSRRFGAPKALARVGGRALIERVHAALAGAPLAEIVLITAEPEPFAALGLRARADTFAGAGPLGGIHAALRWAVEEGGSAALCVACDLPFLSSALVRLLLARAAATDADVVAPASLTGPHAVEPLCAVYSVRCLDEIEARLARGEYALHALLRAVSTEIIPPAEIYAAGAADAALLNVNTLADHATAERIARELERADAEH
jgi:molybdopterin-guanine dinucleotide biosynthesis protein A